MHPLRSKASSLLGSLSVPQLKKKAFNSFAAVQDTYFSTKDTFERHKVVFTIGTSIASVGTALAGYTIRHYHDTRVDQRLESIENAMKTNQNLEHSDLKKIVDPGSSRVAAWMATAGTTFIIGYGFGWRGGRWYANRQFRKEQMKLMGQIKPKRWQLLRQIKPGVSQLQFLGRPLTRFRALKDKVKSSKTNLKNTPTTLNSGEANARCNLHSGANHQSC